METERYASRNGDGGHGRPIEIARVKDDQLAAVGGPVVDKRHDPTIVFGGLV